VNYDVQAIRQHFPSLDTGIAFFDGPGGSQVPDVVEFQTARLLWGLVD